MSHSSDIKFHEPSPPFVSTSFSLVDRSWKNPGNGNSISFLSECQNHTEDSLQSIQSGILQGIQNLSIESSEYRLFNERQALFTLAKGEVDGLVSKLALTIFIKDSCLFVLSYVAADSTFAANHADFNEFLKGFVVP